LQHWRPRSGWRCCWRAGCPRRPPTYRLHRSGSSDVSYDAATRCCTATATSTEWSGFSGSPWCGEERERFGRQKFALPLVLGRYSCYAPGLAELKRWRPWIRVSHRAPLAAPTISRPAAEHAPARRWEGHPNRHPKRDRVRRQPALPEARRSARVYPNAQSAAAKPRNTCRRHPHRIAERRRPAASILFVRTRERRRATYLAPCRDHDVRPNTA
jgi:hypothetical protein